MKKLTLIAAVLIFIAGVAATQTAPNLIFAVNESAPGQTKKTGDLQTGSKSQGNANKVTGTAKKYTDTNVATPSATKNLLIRDFVANRLLEKKTLKIGTVKLKEYLLAEGTGSAAPIRGIKFEKFTARIATPGAQLKRHAVSGVITGMGAGFVTIAHQIQRDRVYTVYYNSATVVKIKGMENATGANLAVGMRIAAVGEPADDNSLLAKRIHVIPGKATGVFTKHPLATESAEASASPTPVASVSATPSVSLTPSPTHTATPSPTLAPTATPTP